MPWRSKGTQHFFCNACEKLNADRKAIDTLRKSADGIVSARKSAFDKAHADFKAALEKARQDLKAAFGK
ncbi:MAG: hypothetical protein AAB444_03015 [Patescibacteria group bacterium]